MIELRPYQEESIALLRDAFKNKHKRIVLALTTGSGKTVIFSEMVRRSAEKGTKTLVLTDRIELFKQTFNALKRIEVPSQLISADNKNFYKDAMISIGMVETVKRRPLEGYIPELIIIDEAHKGNFTKIIERFPDARIIGVTATPVGKLFFKYYTQIIQPIDTPELVEKGFLSPCKGFQMQDDFSDLNVSGNDYSGDSLFKHYNKAKLYAGVVQEYQKRTPGQKAVIFNVNIEHSKNMNDAFKAAGIHSECVTSETPEHERIKILAAFESGLFPVLNNCSILTTGWDCPSVEVIIMNRATMSLPLWLQCCGRGSRIYRNKHHFTILDFGGNFMRHGLWDEARKWELAPPKKRKLKEQPAPIKKCPQCEAIVAARALKCVFCSFEFEIKDNELKEGIMVEVKPKVPSALVGKKAADLNLDELAELQKSKKYKPTFVWRVVRSKGEEAIKEYAGKMGYKNGWIERQIQDQENSEFNNYILK